MGVPGGGVGEDVLGQLEVGGRVEVRGVELRADAPDVVPLRAQLQELLARDPERQHDYQQVFRALLDILHRDEVLDHLHVSWQLYLTVDVLTLQREDFSLQSIILRISY